MKRSILFYPFIGIYLILAMDVALSISVLPAAASSQKIKPLVMERAAIKEGIKPTEMGKDEAEQLKKEKEEVKKLLVKHNEKVKKQLEKRAKELEKDEKYQQRTKEFNAVQTLRPEKKRKPALSIAEINANSNYAQMLYHGDIQLTLEQAKIMFAKDDDDHDDQQSAMATDDSWNLMNSINSSGRKRRGAAINATTFPDKKWPSLYYPFSFDSSVCICTTEGDHLRCNCVLLGIVAHEIGHSLGFDHEQQRYDRDDFLEVYTDNIVPKELHNFDKHSSTENDNYGIAYDLGSLMQYEANAYSKDKHQLLTLEPKAGAMYRNTLGQRFGPSHSDYIMMNKLYCGLSFSSSSLSRNTVKCHMETVCQNNGFQNPNKCSACICPPGYHGIQCERTRVQGHAPNGVPNTCNGTELLAQSEWKELSGQIGDTTMDERADYAYCHWKILGDQGKTIYIEVQDVGNDDKECIIGCFWGNTEIRTSANKGDSGVRLCCKDDLNGSNKTLTITAPNGYAMISLYAYKNIQRFHLRFRQQ